MKPAKFNYYQPITIDETLNLLSNYGDEGKVLAGGQSFIPVSYTHLTLPTILLV